MAFAVHILAHKNPTQIDRLFRVLYHQEDVFIIHLDRRSSNDLHLVGQRLAKEYPNVLLQKPRAVLWGGPQIPDLQIEAMELALKHSPNWGHFINLSGQDFPLRPRHVMLDELSTQPGVSYLTWCDPFVNRIWENVEQRVERWHLHSPYLERFLSIPWIGRRLRAVAGWQNQLAYVPWFRRRRPDFFQ